MNKNKIMSLFEEGARIQPSGLAPIEGIDHIELFWFPNDSSKTTIFEYKTELVALKMMDTLALSTHT
ncbi:MAG: hypothetical protein AAGC47_10220, partial [Bacteroidota bacterium]